MTPILLAPHPATTDADMSITTMLPIIAAAPTALPVVPLPPLPEPCRNCDRRVSIDRALVRLAAMNVVRPARRKRSRSTPFIWLPTVGTAAIVATAMLAAIARVGSRSTDVPLVAAIGIAVGIVRWQPSLELEPLRSVPTALVLLLLAGSLEVWLLAAGHPSWRDASLGPLVSIGTVAVYLVCFGFRSPFLLRRLVVLGVLTWTSVAATVDTVVRGTIGPLSDLLYRRLGALPWLGVTDRPWRLFSAMTDRGSLIVIGVVVWGVAVSRRRLSVNRVVVLVSAAIGGMLLHHSIMLAAPIEEYAAPGWVGVVTGPITELAIAAAAVVLVSLIGRRRRRESSGHSTTTVAADRDPVIFSAPDDSSTLAMVLCVGVALAPVVMIVSLLPFLGAAR